MVEFLLMANILLLAWHVFDHNHLMKKYNRVAEKVEELEKVVGIKRDQYGGL